MISRFTRPWDCIQAHINFSWMTLEELSQESEISFDTLLDIVLHKIQISESDANILEDIFTIDEWYLVSLNREILDY